MIECDLCGHSPLLEMNQQQTFSHISNHAAQAGVRYSQKSPMGLLGLVRLTFLGPHLLYR